MITINTLESVQEYLKSHYGKVDMNIDRTYQGNVRYRFKIYSVTKEILIYKNFKNGTFQNFNIMSLPGRVYGELSPRVIDEAVDNSKVTPTVFERYKSSDSCMAREAQYQKEKKVEKINKQKKEYEINIVVEDIKKKPLVINFIPNKKSDFIEYYKQKYCHLGMNVKVFKAVMLKIKAEADNRYPSR